VLVDCGKDFQWFSGIPFQICSDCKPDQTKTTDGTEIESVTVSTQSTTDEANPKGEND